jgi:hypothetical protein
MWSLEVPGTLWKVPCN